MTLDSIESLLHETIGLDASTLGTAGIETLVRFRMRRLGCQHIEEYLQRIQASEEELQELIEDVVVPETWFFRHPASFAAMTRFVTQDGPLTKHIGLLRVLSIPCASGEESYSIAITLLEAGLAANQFKIDALDVSRKALNRAIQAQYRPISFRGSDLGAREHYFERTQQSYQIVERVRRQVRFHQGNLIAPDFLTGEEPYHLIFCRNVLIYFDRTTQEQALHNLERLLSPQGILFVGAGEAGIAAAAGCTPVDSPASFAFHFGKADPALSSPMFDPSRQTYKPAVLRRTVQPRPVPVMPKAVVQALEPPPSTSVSNLGDAGRLADAGRLEEAAALCEDCLCEAGPSAAAYYLLGLIHDARGDTDRAISYYRKAQYLEPEHAEALLHLALAQEKRGDIRGAKRLRERIGRINS